MSIFCFFNNFNVLQDLDSSGLKGACDVFPLDVARRILGDGAERGQGTQPDMFDAPLPVEPSMNRSEKVAGRQYVWWKQVA